MAEIGGANIEVAHHLNESKPDSAAHRSRIHELLEIVEAIVLALVAITTAWSGYQAARWDGQQSLLYGQASRLRVQAENAEQTSNQQRVYDASTVVEWLKAEAHGEEKLAELFERRLLPEIRPAFAAWKATDPLHNPSAAAGPAFMPQYRNSKAEEAASLNQEATEKFELGTLARERADQYVRMTVVLATVLLLTAISQRFSSHRIRVALVTLAFLLVLIPLCRILLLPRA
jgi:hypothetical protein